MTTAPDRRALDEGRLREALDAAGWNGPFPRLLASTPTTNADAVALAKQGAPTLSCVVAEEQTAGRGRLDRMWVSPASGGLWMSVIVQSGRVEPSRWTWLPLVAGLAARDALVAHSGLPVMVKWPNDLVIEEADATGDAVLRKLGGVLSERVAGLDAVVLGIGINVALSQAELPTPEATSLLAQGASVDREVLLATVLVALGLRVGQWQQGDPVLEADYRRACASISRSVQVSLPDGSTVAGVVRDVDAGGALVVNTPEGNSLTVTAGDVIHATIAP